MFIDALLSFVPVGAPLSLVAGAGVDVPSTNVIDLLGLGVGVTPDQGNVIIGNPTVFGAPDAMGVGGLRPELLVNVGTAFATGTAATLNVALQGAADDGTGNPSTWQTFEETGELTAAQLTANQTIMRLPWVPPFPANLRPRFLRLLFQVPAATLFTAGTIANAVVVPCRDDQFNKYAAKNYSVA
jgi:hypothetical protein